MSINHAKWLEVISRERAENDDPWGAVNMQVTADLLRLTEVLIKDGAKIGGEIHNFVVPPTSGAIDCWGVLTAHRNGIVQLVPEATRAAITEYWVSADHLVGLRSPSSDDIEDAQISRLKGMTPKEFRTRQIDYANKMAQASRAMRAAGMFPEAFRAAYRSDIASYIVSIVDMSSRTGDWTFASADSREALALRFLSTRAPGDDLDAAIGVVRNALQWSTFSPEAIEWALVLDA